MSYSICNVLTEAKAPNILRWLPFKLEQADLRNRLRNKMIRPTTIPHTLADLRIEQAVSREALRLAFEHHKTLARTLTGVQQTRTIGDLLDQQSSGGKTLVDLMKLDMIVGSGGVLSHAPRRQEAAYMMLDAYQPQGITMLAVDSIFMMPQLGVLSTTLPEAAAQVFERDCLIKLGTAIFPVGSGREGDACCTVTINGEQVEVKVGQIMVLPLGVNERADVEINPSRGFDMGEGRGKPLTTSVEGGVVGLIIDARGRPLILPQDDDRRVAKLKEWHKAFGLETGD
jgi:hypothetical protein